MVSRRGGQPATTRVWGGLAAAATLAYLALGPREVNGDGIGYLKAVHDGGFYPGHVGYVPLLSALIRLFRAFGWAGPRLVDTIMPARILSAASAGAAAAILGAFVERRTGERARGLLAAGALFASAGFWQVGADIESYAPALLGLITALVLVERRPVLAGLALGATTLLHVQNAAFLLPLSALARRRRDRLAVATAAAAVAGSSLIGLGLHGLGAASHGYPYPLHFYTPLVALWGALRTLVFAPYLYEAAFSRVAAATSLGLLAAVVVGVLCVQGRRAGRRSPISPHAAALWVVPYVLVGLGFYGSDSERWVFLLPLLWITTAALADRRRLALLVGGMFFVNLAFWLPHARDASVPARADAFARTLHPGDLLISPGHGWDESVPLYADGVIAFPLVYHAAARHGAVGLGEALDEALLAARARGGAIVTARLDGAEDPSGTLGWKELARLGLDRGTVEALLRERGVPTRR